VLPQTGGGWEQDNNIVKMSSGDRILERTILLGLLGPQGKPTTVMAMLLVWTWAPFHGAAASLGRREGINLPENMIHHNALCNRSTSF
jgi:hypothetical protein